MKTIDKALISVTRDAAAMCSFSVSFDPDKLSAKRRAMAFKAIGRLAAAILKPDEGRELLEKFEAMNNEIKAEASADADPS